MAPAGSLFELKVFYNNGGERIMAKTKALQDKGLFVLVDSYMVNSQPCVRTGDAVFFKVLMRASCSSSLLGR